MSMGRPARPGRDQGGLAIAAWTVLLGLVCLAGSAHAGWPSAPVRSGTSLPRDRLLSAGLTLEGLYVPRVKALAEGDTKVLGNVLTWNMRLFSFVGLFGEHAVTNMWIKGDHYRLLLFGHEVGARFLIGDHAAVEAAYLTHRNEYQWIDGYRFSGGGIYDHGGEVVGWGRFEPFEQLLLEPRLIARLFDEPNDEKVKHYAQDQRVLGFGLRVSIMPWDGHAVSIELTELMTYRAEPRAGVDQVTWNTIGEITWRSQILSWLGVQLGARASTHMFVGEQPLLELVRSMINEPTGSVNMGVYAQF